MSDPTPAPIAPKSSTFTDQVATANSFADVQRYFQPLSIKVSRNSPPNLNDLNEMQWTFDKTTLKLWILVNGTPRYVQFT